VSAAVAVESVGEPGQVPQAELGSVRRAGATLSGWLGRCRHGRAGPTRRSGCYR